ncbi:MAG: hypothetical protein ACXAC0_04390 [Candidatus Thorarchaeota archaeon]|jgi:transcription initiation factor TFIIB
MTDFDIEVTKQSAKQVLTELDFPDIAHTRCMTILDDKRTKDILTEQNAEGIIAGAIYIAGILTENRLTQQSLADVMDISEATIRKYYVRLVKVLELKKKKI